MKAEPEAPTAPPPLRRTPLYPSHVELGAKLVGFGGWEMPLAYGKGTVAEHRACRTDAVAFDVSHLGTVRVDGPGTFDRLQRTLTNDLTRIGPGRAQYTHLLEDDGSVADDIIVWWIGEDRFDVMPNASNTVRVLDAVGGTDTTARRAVVAVQGPRARERLAHVVPDAAGVGRFRVVEFEWEGTPCLAAGTGYTGEDGVECAVPEDVALGFWEAVLAAGVAPAGLGARDTLRLEAGLPLHGHELGPGITPLQAGLGWVVGWDKGDFKGRSALERERAVGPRRRLWGLLADGRQPPREGDVVQAVHGPDPDLDADSDPAPGADPAHGASNHADPSADPGAGPHADHHPAAAGVVTSGNFSPMLERGIALALLDTTAGIAAGDRLMAVVRGRALPVTVTGPRFWPPKDPDHDGKG